MAVKLSSRAVRALEVLQAGGKFRYALETDRYTRRDQFRMRLIGADGRLVAGIGYQAKVELEQAGRLQYQHPHDARGSAWPQEWVLRQEVAAAA